MRSLVLGCAAVALVLMVAASAEPARAADEPNPIVAMVEKSGIDTAKPFVLVVKIQAAPGKAQALIDAFAPAVAATRKETGCLQYDLTHAPASPEAFLLYERWNCLDDLARHLQAPHITELLGKLGGVTDGPPEASVHKAAVK